MLSVLAGTRKGTRNCFARLFYHEDTGMSSPPNPRPVLIYDGKCSFCRIWINYWRQLTGDRIEYTSSQEAADRFPQIPAQAYREAVQLVRPDGTFASGARAVAESLGKLGWYQALAAPADLAYRFIAGHRNLLYQINRFTFGMPIEPSRFAATQWLFLRALAVIYMVAFASLASQVTGLLGEHGILPVGEFLKNVAAGSGGIRYLAVPSVFWFGSDDSVLQGFAYLGVALAVVLMLTGFRSAKFQRLTLILLYILYLSFAAVGQEFLGFQWDSLLLETGFLALFLTPSSQIVPWLFRWLGFRLIFLSGAVKLLSGDATWHSLSALSFHWHTQPLPTVLAWYADKLPLPIQHAATWFTLAIEIVVPFAVFCPRKIRMAGAFILIGFQILILLTGNYTFFNLLTIALLLFWFDDRALRRVVPESVWTEKPKLPPRLIWALPTVIVLLGLLHMLQTFGVGLPVPASAALRYTSPLQIVNTYGLFASMTTQRLEIVLEASYDEPNGSGQHGNDPKWTPYEFRYKPGDPKAAPKWVAPHQPRLDWQMWFAALGSYRENIWLVNLAVRLLEGSPAVAELIKGENQPPRFIRAVIYEYKFTDWATHRKTGEWWTREPRGVYLPAVALKETANPQ